MNIDGHKHFGGICIKSAGTPTADQLALIRPFMLDDIQADQICTRQFVLAHNFIDRDNECFDEGLLADFAKTLPGKGIFVKGGHPSSWGGDSGPPEGKWYAANLKTMSGDEARAMLREPSLQLPPDRNTATLLIADSYFVRTPDNQSHLLKMAAGIGGDVSIGFGAASRTPLKDAEGRELQACRVMGPGEAYEGSLVWLGAQPGARAVKGKKSTKSNSEDSAMDVDVKDLKAQLDTANTAVKALEPHKTFREALKSALGKDNEALAEDAPQLAALVIAGKGFRDSLIDGLVTADRVKGAVGDKPEDAAAAKAAYGNFPLSTLKTLSDIAEKSAKPGGAGIRPSDPNNTANGGTKSAAPEGSPLSNPLI